VKGDVISKWGVNAPKILSLPKGAKYNQNSCPLIKKVISPHQKGANSLYYVLVLPKQGHDVIEYNVQSHVQHPQSRALHHQEKMLCDFS
jgi:hypothetical protein